MSLQREIKMDIDLYYKEQGTGKPLILLHGNGESGEYFEHQISFFSGKYRVIVIDTRGHGKISEQLPVEIWYQLAKFSACKSQESRKKAELLSLMVNDPFIKISDLQKIAAPTLVLAGTRDMIKEKHTRLISLVLQQTYL